LKLARDHKPAADDIERVDVWTHTRRLEHTNRPEPKSDLDAKFSVQYCMTRALLDRRISMEHFEGLLERLGRHGEMRTSVVLSTQYEGRPVEAPTEDFLRATHSQGWS